MINSTSTTTANVSYAINHSYKKTKQIWKFTANVWHFYVPFLISMSLTNAALHFYYNYKCEHSNSQEKVTREFDRILMEYSPTCTRLEKRYTNSTTFRAFNKYKEGNLKRWPSLQYNNTSLIILPSAKVPTP